jgi:hypothetical protein
VQGAYTDLFFWNVLHNRKEMSKVMWERVYYPVRTSLAAAYLLRQMAEAYENIDPMTADDMRANADFFEEQAVEVQNQAEGEDQAVALMSLDCDLPLWRGMGLIDLAIASQSRRFLETCCPEV